jgi:thiamine biosynthesis lipoprotein
MDIAVPRAHAAGFRVEHIMGIPILIDVRDGEVDPVALDRAFDWLRLVDATFSTYKADSEICRINRGELPVADAGSDVREILARCAQLREETGGYFDISAPYPRRGGAATASPRPEAMDPSGLVKGWSVVRAGLILEAAGARNYLINAGGDILARGRPALDAPYWRVGVQHPRQRDKLAAVVAVRDRAIATSGAYERGNHIIDPYSGGAPAGVLSVTIVGPDLATADAYATAAFAMGAAGPAWTSRLPGYEAMTILADETVLSTVGFPSV